MAWGRMESATAWTIRSFGSIVTIRSPSASTQLSRPAAGLGSTLFMLPLSRLVGTTTAHPACASTAIMRHLFWIRTGIIWKRYFVAIERKQIELRHYSTAAARCAPLIGRRAGSGTVTREWGRVVVLKLSIWRSDGGDAAREGVLTRKASLVPSNVVRLRY